MNSASCGLLPFLASALERCPMLLRLNEPMAFWSKGRTCVHTLTGETSRSCGATLINAQGILMIPKFNLEERDAALRNKAVSCAK